MARTQGMLWETGKLALAGVMSHHSCFEFISFLSRDAMCEVGTTEWESLRTACETLDDSRTPINKFHSVENIVAISLAAIIAGAEGPISIARWANNKQDWLATWIDLPNGKTPSRDCIRTCFARVDPAAFQACFFAWLDGLAGDSKQSNGLRIVAIDGKSLRRSACRTPAESVWPGIYSANVGRMKCEEITLPELLGEAGYVSGQFGKWHLGTRTNEIRDANRGGSRGNANYAPPRLHVCERCFVTESKVPTFDPMIAPPNAPRTAWGVFKGPISCSVRS